MFIKVELVSREMSPSEEAAFPKLSAIHLEKLVRKPTTVTSTITLAVHVAHSLPHTRDVRNSNAPAQLKVLQALGFKSR